MTSKQKAKAKKLAYEIAPKSIKHYEKNYDNIQNRISPVYAGLDGISMLYDTMKEMERANLINGDNYYHRLGMCKMGQKNTKNPFYLPIATLAGTAKEAYDIAKKTLNDEVPMSDTLYDSYKDMKNNVEGFYYGVTHPEQDCREWLDDLDIKTNTWKTNNR